MRLRPPSVPEQQVPYLLKALADAGWIIRLRRGLYAGTGQLPGGVDVPPFVLATALTHPDPSAIGLWSALSYHDLTDQVPVVVTAITTKKVVTPSLRKGSTARDSHLWHVAGIDCRYVTLTEQRYRIGLETAWLGERFRFSITDRERTVLDTFAMPRHFGGVGEGLDVLERALSTLDVERLVDYALRYGSHSLVKRLGWSLERAGARTSQLRPLLESATSSYAVLDPGRPSRGQHDKRWRLILNLTAADPS